MFLSAAKQRRCSNQQPINHTTALNRCQLFLTTFYKFFGLFKRKIFSSNLPQKSLPTAAPRYCFFPQKRLVPRKKTLYRAESTHIIQQVIQNCQTICRQITKIPLANCPKSNRTRPAPCWTSRKSATPRTGWRIWALPRAQRSECCALLRSAIRWKWK